MPIYICPISLDAPKVPVITNEGITYDFVSISRSLLRENTNHHANFNPTLDPTTHRVIDTLIYNRAAKELNDLLMDAVLPLSHEEKREIALLYTQLISRYPALKINGIHTLDGMQAVIDAIKLEVVLAQQLQPNFVDADGRTSLYIAAKNGLVDVVRQLLMHDDVRPNQGMTLARLCGSTPLIAAAQYGHVPVALALLADPRVEPNQAKADGATALFMAILNGHEPVVMALLADPRIEPNQAKADGVTPLLLAAQYGHVTIVTALLAAGANPHQAMTDGATPLFAAILFGHFEVVQAVHRHQHAAMAHLPIPIATQHGYPVFVKGFLSDEAVRDYCLNQVIIKPELMRAAFTLNPVFFTELATHSNALWARLREPAHFNLSPDEYSVLLRTILDSRQEPNKALHHPLYALFNAPQLQGRGLFSNRTTNTILDDIQAQMDTERTRLLNY